MIDYKNNTYLVVGLGVTGFSVVEYLRAHRAAVIVTDTRLEPPQLALLKNKFIDVPVLLGAISVPDTVTHIILSPGVAISTPEIQAAIARDVVVLGDIELFAQVVDKPVLAVTGSNGKSTVTTLLGAMAQSSGISAGVGGNLGIPALALLDLKHDCYILELSSFQLETLRSLRPKVVTILNISPDHMDRYDDLQAYQQAKQRVYLNAEYAVVNRQDDLAAVPDTIQTTIISFGLDVPQDDNYGLLQHLGASWLAKGQLPLMPVQQMTMLGEHNVANALAALAMGEIAGFDMAAMLSTLRKFRGLEHRCEQIVIADNVVWVNDSKGTNVAATIAAIEGLSKSIIGKWIIILGGVGKGADFTPLLGPVVKHCKAAILIGEAAPQLWDLLHNAIPCYKAVNLAEVITIAQQHAVSYDGVLLSPACASFDMFNNYIHRGDLFKQQVLQRIDTHYAKNATN